MLYRIKHITTYEYAEPVSISQTLARLTPRNLPGQTCLQSSISVSPKPTGLVQYDDFFGNRVTQFDIETPHTELTVTASSTVEVVPLPVPPLEKSAAWDEVIHQGEINPAEPLSSDAIDALQFTFPSTHARMSEAIRAFALPSFPAGRPIFEGAMDLTSRIFSEFKFDPTATTVSTPVEELLTIRGGVCQDFAHLMIAAMRSLSLPVRYVSGYLRTDPPAGKPRLIGADASHAWVAVFDREFGWLGFDPTNNCIASDRHVTIGFGRDYEDVSPIRGVVLGGGAHELDVSVDAAPVAAGV